MVRQTAPHRSCVRCSRARPVRGLTSAPAPASRLDLSDRSLSSCSLSRGRRELHAGVGCPSIDGDDHLGARTPSQAGSPWCRCRTNRHGISSVSPASARHARTPLPDRHHVSGVAPASSIDSAGGTVMAWASCAMQYARSRAGRPATSLVAILCFLTSVRVRQLRPNFQAGQVARARRWRIAAGALPTRRPVDASGMDFHEDFTGAGDGHRADSGNSTSGPRVLLMR